MAGAGDVVAWARNDERGGGADSPRGVVELAVGGEAPRRVGALNDCPTVAAAADGTAVIGFAKVGGRLAHPRLVIRRPGGVFGSAVVPARPDPSAFSPRVAAAPGGWVAAAWLQQARVGRGIEEQVAAAVVSPDGNVRGAVMDRARLTSGEASISLSVPDVGIDRYGVATVTWTRWRVNPEERAFGHRVRVARTTTGATAWRPAVTLGASDHPPDPYDGTPLVGLAVAAEGPVLLAWDTPTALRSVAGDTSALGPTTTLAQVSGAATPTVALTDSGRALVAFSRQGSSRSGPFPRAEVLAVDREAVGPWAAPHRISGEPSDQGIPPEGTPLGDEVQLTSAVSANGQAIVAWSAYQRDVTRAVVATGRTGGAWSAPQPVSLATRDAALTPWATLSLTGDPLALWTESPSTSGTIRATRLAADTQVPPADVAPPSLIVRLPARAQATRAWNVALRLRVECSEACDVRARLVDPDVDVDVGGELAYSVRAAAANQPRMLTVKGKVPLSTWQQRRRVQRRRLEVLATDRAGNLTRRSQIVTILRARD